MQDITGTVLDKATLLHVHGPQMHPARAMYRPIRHAHTVAFDMPPDPTGRPATRPVRGALLPPRRGTAIIGLEGEHQLHLISPDRNGEANDMLLFD
ncbi:hypothetical protein ACFXB4_35285 [Streptomyces lavendulae]|uniref:hypothetical protein n=1 Tax=Streptomyces lavendulae TaxID=1914 RepID=UPI0031E877FB